MVETNHFATFVRSFLDATASSSLTRSMMKPMQALVLPIAQEFAPTLVLVAAGFDAAAGDPCGVRYRVTPAQFGRMTSRLASRDALPSARGRVALVLEGGEWARVVCARATDPSFARPERDFVDRLLLCRDVCRLDSRTLAARRRARVAVRFLRD